MSPEMEYAVNQTIGAETMQRYCYDMRAEAEYDRIVEKITELARAHKTNTEVTVLRKNVGELTEGLRSAGFMVVQPDNGLKEKRAEFCTILRVSWARP